MTRALLVSVLFHGALALLMLKLSGRPRAKPQEALQIAVVETKPAAREPPPKPPPPRELPKPPPRKAPPLKIARAQTPPPPIPTTQAPPPPSHEAAQPTKEPVVVTGITMESTSQGGSFAVGVGNTLQGAPPEKAVEPRQVKPYKAEKYAAAATVTELPRPLNGESVNLRKYYPPQALKEGFEGDVVLRLLIDADGSVAKVEIVSDPGEGLGPAAARMVKIEYRFSPATVNGTPVATTVPFTVHFTLN